MALQTYSGLTAEQKTFYERVLLERLTPTLLYQKYGQAKPMPKNEGDTVCFRRFEGFDAALTPLTEGVAPSGQSLSIKTITATVEQYGDFVEISDKLDMAGIDPVLTEVAKMFGEQAGDTIDKVVRNVVTAGTTVIYPKGRADRASITASDILTVSDIKRAVTVLRKNNAKPIDGKYFIGIFSPSQISDLMEDEDWKEYAIQASLEMYAKGEAGMIHGVKILDSTNVPVVNNGTTDVHLGLIIGKDAYGVVDIDGSSKPEMIVKPHGSAGTADPLNQKATSGWKAMLAAVRLNELAMCRVESAVTL